jgi:hypothetical protein
MPPKSLFKSNRTQSLAVALVMALVLVCVTGLASLQAGSGPLTTTNKYELQQSAPVGTSEPGTIQFNLPEGWEMSRRDQGGLVLVDPDRPSRQLNLVTVVISEQATPEQMIYRFIELHPDPSFRATLRPASQPFAFSLAETGLRGAQFIGTSDDDDGMVREHLLACLSPDGVHYWLIYLTDTVASDSDVGESLRANTRLLQLVYRSARVAKEDR